MSAVKLPYCSFRIEYEDCLDLKNFADNKETKLVMVYIMILQLIVNTFTSQLVIIQAPHKVAVPGDLVCTDLLASCRDCSIKNDTDQKI